MKMFYFQVPLDERFIFRFFVDKKAKISDPQVFCSLV